MTKTKPPLNWRRNLLLLFAPLIIAISCLANPTQIATSIDKVGKDVHAPNFARIADYYYRGAQPDDIGLKEIATMGVHTVVDLRGEDRSRTDHERQTTESLGMQYISLPLSSFRAPSDEQVEKFLSIIHNTVNQPVFVHCLRGADRTGVMTAIMRINDFNWTADKAYDEMKERGFRSSLLPTMKNCVYKYADKRLIH